MTYTADHALQGFQFLHVDHRGRQLTTDGKMGPLTRWADCASRATPERQLAAIKAARLLPIRERTGRNDHPAIGWLFYNAIGRTLQAAWCAAAAGWCTGRRGTVSAQTLGKRNKAVMFPALGDLAWYETGPWQGHVGVVIAGDNETVMLIEGNRQNGGRVVRRRRADLKFSSPFCDDHGAGERILPPLPEKLPITETTAYDMEGTR